MKKTEEMIGLPIISIADGMEIGNVKSLIVDTDDRKVSYFVVDRGMHLLGAKVIPSEGVLGIGEYAMTIENEDAILTISKVPAAIQLLEKNIAVKGSKMLTERGKMAGEVTEVYFDENDDCKIKGIEFMPLGSQQSVKFLPDKYVMTYGKQLVIVYDSFESMASD